MFGFLSLLFLSLIYLRSILKRLVKRYPNLQNNQFLKYLILILNKTHCLCGILATIFIIIHCAVQRMEENIFLQLIIVLAVVWSITGFLMKINLLPESFRHWSYRAHARLILSGLLFLALFALGHAFLD